MCSQDMTLNLPLEVAVMVAVTGSQGLRSQGGWWAKVGFVKVGSKKCQFSVTSAVCLPCP